ncbi:MAG: patatin-like phospholipase family protein [Alphaproteobacteria bacterium]|nr:patatin-like phospholipase family protein [Alphaproteobacteria bacterium]
MTHTSKKIVNLALQGGGAHGAFTWGVLEQLLLDGRVAFKTISGTSAGSMNAAVFAYGLLKGGADKTIQLLEMFWRKVSDSGRFGAFAASNTMDQLLGPMKMMASGTYAGFDMMSKYFSPYQLNPLGLNPLKDVLLSLIDFDELRKSSMINLHISATDVLRSKLKIFTGNEITVEAVLASACLPQLFQAVVIDGNYYWDGGFMGNPSLFPLTECDATNDIMIVQIDPIFRDAVPRTSDTIADRLNEISFNSPLLVELRGLRLVNKLLIDGHLNEQLCGLRQLHLHMVGDEKVMSGLPLESKFNPEWNFLLSLREAGKTATKKWLSAHFDDLGVKSTLDIDKLVA